MLEALYCMNLDELASNKAIQVMVKPNAPKTEIIDWDGIILKVAIHATPDKGKANAELIKFLSKTLKKKVEIISGHTSRKKLVKVI